MCNCTVRRWLQLWFNFSSTAIRLQFDRPIRPFDNLYYDRAAALRPKQAVREAATICPRPLQVDLSAFDLLTMKVMSESRVTWAASVPSLVFLGLSVLDLGPMHATERQTSDAHHRLMPPPNGAGAQ